MNCYVTKCFKILKERKRKGGKGKLEQGVRTGTGERRRENEEGKRRGKTKRINNELFEIICGSEAAV